MELFLVNTCFFLKSCLIIETYNKPETDTGTVRERGGSGLLEWSDGIDTTYNNYMDCHIYILYDTPGKNPILCASAIYHLCHV